MSDIETRYGWVPTWRELRELDRSVASAAKVERWARVPVLLAAIIAVPAIILEASVDPGPLKTVAHVLGWFVWLAFLVEFMLAMRTAPHRVSWMRSHPIELLVLLMTPPFIGGFWVEVPYIGALARTALLLPLLLPIIRMRRLVTISSVASACLVSLVLIFSAGVMYPNIEPTSRGVHDAGDGIWWALVTATTTGYGDIVPQTLGGRAIAVLVMLVGMVFMGMLTALIVDLLVESRVGGQIRHAERDIEYELHEVLQKIERRLASLESRLPATKDE